MSRSLSNVVRIFLLLGFVTAVLTLSVHAAPTAQEAPRPRFNLEDVPYQPTANSEQPTESGLSVTAPQAILSWSKVAFQSYRDGNWNIYVGNDDGSGQTAVATGGTSEIQPHLNRGNTRIVYASNSGGDYEIYTMNTDGSGKTAVTNNSSNDGNPSWSPDGSKIVFETYRHGEADIYVMNADGSNQVRLTTDADFDGMPTWSPDGSKIAFSSRRTGGYRIYVMNADGTGQTQLSNQPYSLHPHWSPDGSQIAYDTDNDGDGWQDLWRMNADGSSQTQVYNPSGQTDAWASGWSPNNSRITFTLISFIQYQGNWYWTNAYLDAWAANTSNIRLSSNGLDWDASWQTGDITPPVSEINALPTQSPGPIPVSWSFSDSGGSSVGRFSVQVKVGDSSWADWLTETSSTSAAYPGVGGETYAFRVRARDNAFNYEAWPAGADSSTTVETLPPTTTITALPAYSRFNKDLVVSWGGTDAGLSGIKNYDVQYKIGTDVNWVNWKTDTLQTTAVLSGGAAAETYYFRVRGTDRAENTESWPTGNGDAQTTFYRWASYGLAYDNTHTPISGASSTTSPTAACIVPSSIEGSYISYVLNNSTLYAASWSKPGYGSLPSTSFLPEPDGYKALVLPPADNIITNWGFETGTTNPEWNATGALPQSVITTTQNSGDYSLGLGIPNAISVSNLSTFVGEYVWPRSAFGPNGEAVLLWRDINGEGPNTLFSELLPDGSWSSPIIISSSSTQFAGIGNVSFSNDGTIHVLFIIEVLQGSMRKGDLYYTSRSPAKSWSTPTRIYTTTNSFGNSIGYLNLLESKSGILHLAWQENIMTDYSTTCGDDVFYMQRSLSGSWSAAINVSQTCGVGIVDSIHIFELQEKLHVLWIADDDIYHKIRNANGTWSQSQYVISMGQHTRIAGGFLDNDGVLHLLVAAVFKDYGYYLNYRGAWSQGVQLPTNSSAQMAGDNEGNLHIGWRHDDTSEIFYMKRSPDAVWHEPHMLADNSVFGRVDLVGEPDSKVHMFWTATPDGNNDILYSWRDINDVWTVPKNLSNTVDQSSIAQVGVDILGNYHLIISEYDGNSYPKYFYYGPEYALSESSGSISQEIVLLPNLANPILSFMYQLGGIGPNGASELVVKLNNSGIEETVFSTKNSTPGWVHQWIDLSAWANETVTLTFELTQAANSPTAWAYLDEITLGSTFTDVWVDVESVNAGIGEIVPVTLSYGNRGGAVAENIEISLSLPANLAFVGSDVGSVNATTPTWQVGSLPAKSDIQTIVVYVRVKQTAPSFTNLSTSVTIETSSNELETANNTATGTLFTGKYVYLPIMQK